MTYTLRSILLFLVLTLALFPGFGWALDIGLFEGTFEGSATFQADGPTVERDLSTTIEPTKQGFKVSWTSVTYRSDGTSKAKTYAINFVSSDREHVFGSAMQTNLFGKAVPLDPLQGDPFVWARFEGEVLSVYSLFIDATGGYEMQEFHRSLAPKGLDLVFRRFRNGVNEREIEALLLRQ